MTANSNADPQGGLRRGGRPPVEGEATVVGPLRMIALDCRCELRTIIGAMIASAGLAGCGESGVQPSMVESPPTTSSTTLVAGTVQGGNFPVSNANVLAYAAGNGSPGSSAVAVACVETDNSGNFAFSLSSPTAQCNEGVGSGLPQNFVNCTNCPGTTSALIYLVAVGGNPGLAPGTQNAALALMAALGPYSTIPQSGVDISELTTVAAAYGLAQMLGAGNSPLSSVLANDQLINGNAVGLPIAFDRTLSLVSPDSQPGSALSELSCLHASGDPVNCGALEKLDSLANSLTACANTTGATSAGCEELFCDATPSASFNSAAGTCSVTVVPSDTLQAALSVALNPGLVAITDLETLGGNFPAFLPTLNAAPTDWTLSLNFMGAGLSEPTTVAVDELNNIWVSNYNGAVSKFDALGSPLSPSSGYLDSSLEESFGLAISLNGQAWVTNEQSSSDVNGGLGSLTLFNPDGSLITESSNSGNSLDFPVAIAFDQNGVAWVANDGNATVSSYSADGTSLSVTVAGISGLAFPSGIAIDGNGQVWISNSSSDSVTELASDGTPLSGSSGYTGGGLRGPSAIALDLSGNAWITNARDNSLTVLSPTGAPLFGSPLLETGLVGPAGVAIDSSGTVWVTNYHGNSLSAFAGTSATSPGATLSSAAGFSGAGLSQPFGPTIDEAGNLWTANFGDNSLTEFIGVAAPVKTPKIGLPSRP